MNGMFNTKVKANRSFFSRRGANNDLYTKSISYERQYKNKGGKRMKKE